MVSFLSHQPFRQRDNLPDIPDTKQDVRAFRMHHFVKKFVVNAECIHPDNEKVQSFQVIHIEIPPEFRFVGDDIRRELKLYFLVYLKSLPSLEVVIKEVPSNSLISMLLVSPSS